MDDSVAYELTGILVPETGKIFIAQFCHAYHIELSRVEIMSCCEMNESDAAKTKCSLQASNYEFKFVLI